ncbi:MAG: KOW domain-containing RNA-binding protein [Syntrophomonadaceae bacterium]|nr:KOW domain-containing RNA-binding protein [Syntrophomonadaceae bacterium]MDD3023624.1 KOW domain-containing RNA-binding protein [Syntrophomonadaceae bacterium]
MDDRIGKIVYSKTGRDKGRMLIVVEVVNERQVLVADGEWRKIENPKMKNVKHLQWTKNKAEDIISCRRQGKIPDNHIIRKSIKMIQDTGEGGLVDG